MSIQDFERKLPTNPKVYIEGDWYAFTKGVIAAIFRTDDDLRGGRPGISIAFADPGPSNANMESFLAKSSGSADIKEFLDKHVKIWRKANSGKSLRDHLKEMVVMNLEAAGIPLLEPDNVLEVQDFPKHANRFITLANANDLGRTLLTLGMPRDQVDRLYDGIDRDTSAPVKEEPRLVKAYHTLERLLNRLLPNNVDMVFGNHAREAAYTSLMVKDNERDLTTIRETLRTAIVAREFKQIAQREQLSMTLLPGPFTGTTFNASNHVRDADKRQDFVLLLAEYFLKDNIGKNGLREEDINNALREVRDAMHQERSQRP